METQSQTSSTTGLPTSGKITISAFNPKTQLPSTCRPLADKTGKLYTGQGVLGYYENLTEADKKELAEKGIPIIDFDTSYILEDGKVVDMSDPIQAGHMKWVWKHPYLATDKSKKTRDSTFYVVNAQKDAKAYVDKTAKTDEARPAVRRLSSADQVKAAEALGLSAAHTFPPDQLLEWLLNKCNTDAVAVLAVINPENSAKVAATRFFKEIERYGVIERMKDGSFYFGGEQGAMIGHSDEVVIAYLLAPENKERARAMKAMLAEKTKVAQPIENVV